MTSDIQLEDCEIVDVSSFSAGTRALKTDLSIKDFESIPAPRPVDKVNVPKIVFENAAHDPNKTVAYKFLPVKRPQTNIILPPAMRPLAEIVEKATYAHYVVNGFSNDDYAFLHIIQGVINQGEELNPYVGLHADITLKDSRGYFFEEDIFCASSCLDTQFFELPDKQISSNEVAELKRHASSEFGAMPDAGENYEPPFQGALSAHFLERVKENPECERLFGANTLVNISSISPHRGRMAKEDETFRTFIAVRFMPYAYKGNYPTNSYLDTADTKGRQEIMRTASAECI